MPELKIAPGDVSIGAIVIDWDKKKITFHGMNGDTGTDDFDISPDEVIDIIECESSAGKEAYALIFWHDNHQLCAHDVETFKSEVYEEEIDEEEIARQDKMIDNLELLGFDHCDPSDSGGVRVGCTQCQASVINGVACHENGCPNQRYECKGCSNVVSREGSYCEDCM